MHGTGTAESIDDKFLRQVTRAYDLATNQIGHLGVDNIVDAHGGFMNF